MREVPVRWLPVSSFSFQTDLPLERIVERATSQVEPFRWLANPFRRRTHPFHGRVGRDGFKVSPTNHWYQHQSLNVAVGRFVQTPTGVRVDVRFRLKGAITAFFGILVAALLLGAWAQAEGHPSTDMHTFGFPLLMLAFLYVTTMVRFNHEEGPARAVIQAWFGANVRQDATFYRPPPIG